MLYILEPVTLEQWLAHLKSDARWVSPTMVHVRPDPFNKGQTLQIRPRPDVGHFVIDGVKVASASMAQDGSDAILVDSETNESALRVAADLGATCVRVEDD
ncbi:MAG: hypothetical protein AB8H86_33245 [Polyangiales bacterium]